MRAIHAGPGTGGCTKELQPRLTCSTRKPQRLKHLRFTFRWEIAENATRVSLPLISSYRKVRGRELW